MLKILLLFLYFICIQSELEFYPEISIKQGKLRGFHLTSRKGRYFNAFHRIPYAKAPVGDLRFKSPQPPEKWEGVLETMTDVPSCTQRNILVPGEAENIIGQEDCLYMNVYTPQINKDDLLDVMVYIHGGGWFAGSGSDYSPMHFMDKDVVLVYFNYRLGPLGFLSTEDEVCPGNNGLKDQVAALQWVQENIAAFGGNPNSVTIFGNSAGGASVHYHVLSPASKGLFHRAIAQSGSALSASALAPHGSALKNAKKLASLFKCPKENSNAIIECLRKIDAEKIIATDRDFMEWGIFPLIPFKPVVETGGDAFLPATPLELAKNLENNVPFMTGVTSDEGAILAARFYGEHLVSKLDENFEDLAPMTIFVNKKSPQTSETIKHIREFYFGDKRIIDSPRSRLVDLYTDALFLHGANLAVKLLLKKDTSPIYFYNFAYRGSRSMSEMYGDPSHDYGVCHVDELLYLFPGVTYIPGHEPTEEDEKIIDIMITLWTYFAKFGDPTPTPVEGIKWPSVSNPEDFEYIQIDKDGLHVKQGLQKERLKFWDSLSQDILSASAKKDEL